MVELDEDSAETASTIAKLSPACWPYVRLVANSIVSLVTLGRAEQSSTAQVIGRLSFEKPVAVEAGQVAV